MGKNGTAGFSYEHRVNQHETRTEFRMALKRGDFAGLGKRREKV
jgi:hypothetical protein